MHSQRSMLGAKPVPNVKPCQDEPQMYDPTKPFTTRIREAAERTWAAAKDWGVRVFWEGKRAAVDVVLGEWPWIAKEGKLPRLKPASDGIGTKGLLHWINKSHKRGAQDALAMVIDDLAEFGYRLFTIQDTISIQQDDKEKGEPAIFGLTEGLAELAIEHHALLVGGETAVKNTVQGYDMELACWGVRVCEAPKGLRENSVLIGLQSGGFHSNGFTLIRQVYGDRLNEGADPKLLDEVTTPTIVYAKELLELLKTGEGKVHALVHITGGGWHKLRELELNEEARGVEEKDKKFKFNIYVENTSEPNHVFTDLAAAAVQKGQTIPMEKLYKTFNCGVGFVVAVDPSFADQAMRILEKHRPVNLNAKISAPPEGGGQVFVTDHLFSEGAAVAV